MDERSHPSQSLSTLKVLPVTTRAHSQRSIFSMRVVLDDEDVHGKRCHNSAAARGGGSDWPGGRERVSEDPCWVGGVNACHCVGESRSGDEQRR